MKKDIRWEDFFSRNNRYADIINGIGCKGYQVVQESDLKEASTKSGAKNRDALRKVAFGANFALIGLESQEKMDYKMPLRGMAYDLKNYERQAAEIRRKVRENSRTGKADEYLYGFMKDSRLYPSITFVLYSGTEKWNAAESLYEILDFSGIPEALKNMISDYRINVVDIRRLEDTSVFRTDVKQVFDFIRCSEDKEALKTLILTDEGFRFLEEDAVCLLAEYTNSKELEKLIKEPDGRKTDMCKGLKDWMDECRQEGLELGKTDLLRNFLKNGGTKEEAVRLLGVTVEEVEKAEEAS